MGMFFRGNGRPSGFRRGGPWVLACAALLGAGCAAPGQVMRTLDTSHEVICRNLADIVDRADRAFGEARVEDRERMVQAKLGPQVEWRTNHDFSFAFPVSLRAPFPALERWANIFVQFNSISDTYSTASEAATAFDKNKNFTVAWISKFTELFNTGVKANAYWSGGLQAAVRPFIRWEKTDEPYHLFAEQQVYFKTDDRFGGKLTLQADRRIREDSFLRFANAAEYHQDMTGLDLAHVLVYRRPLFRSTYLSSELGASWNTSTPLDPEQDDDHFYYFLRTTGKLGRPWIEYEVRPEVFYVWHHDKPWEYGLKLEIRFIYEAFLPGAQEAPPAQEAPSAAPGSPTMPPESER